MKLPPERVFVIRLSRDAGSTRRGRLCGRADHVSSGNRAYFDSTDELEGLILAILGGELTEEGDEPSGRTPENHDDTASEPSEVELRREP